MRNSSCYKTISPYGQFTEEILRMRELLKGQSFKINELEREIVSLKTEVITKIDSVERMLSEIILK